MPVAGVPGVAWSMGAGAGAGCLVLGAVVCLSGLRIKVLGRNWRAGVVACCRQDAQGQDGRSGRPAAGETAARD